MSKKRPCPILFLDFDRTVFDTEEFILWLGTDRIRTMMQLSTGMIPSPDFARYLYSDVQTVLPVLRETHRIVILTYAKMVPLQRKKLRGSGIVVLVDDIVITTGDTEGKTGKAEAISRYLEAHGDFGWNHIFVDDEQANLDEVSHAHPDMRVIRMVREGLVDSGTHCTETARDLHDVLSLVVK
jgi:FMN phosphatase YigB (HAD superfamily)